MEIIPTPFLLGTSPAKLDEVYPVEFSSSSARMKISVDICGHKYDNEFDQKSIDKNYATIIYCKKTKSLFVIHSQFEMLKMNIKRKYIAENDDENVNINERKDGIHLSAYYQRVAKKRAANPMGDHVKSDLMMATKLERAETMLNFQINLGTKQNSLSFILPEFDINTCEVKDAYKIQKLIPQNLKYELSLYISKLTSSEKDPEYPNFIFTDQLINERLNHISNDEVMFGYLYLLVYTYSLSSKQFLSASLKKQLGESVANYLHNTFTSVVDVRKDCPTRKMTKTDRFRLLNYIIIIHLSFNGFTAKLTPEARRELHLPDNKIIQAYNCIGAKVKKDSNGDTGVYTVSLKAPLKFVTFTRK